MHMAADTPRTRNSRTEDETAVLATLLPGGPLASEFDKSFTCGGCTASAKEWRALGLLMDLVLANKTGRMHIAQFRRRLAWSHGDAQARGTLMLAIAVAEKYSKSVRGYQDGLAACRRRDALVGALLDAEAVKCDGTLGTLASLPEFPRLAGAQVRRVLDMLDGVVVATRKVGVGGRCWKVRNEMCVALLALGGSSDRLWTWLVPLCGQLDRLFVDSQAPASENSGRWFALTIGRHLHDCIRNGGDDTAAPGARDWCTLLHTVIGLVCLEGSNRAYGVNAEVAEDSLRTVARIGRAVVCDLWEVEGAHALMASCADLAATSTRPALAEAGGDLVALFQQAQQYARIDQGSASARRRRLA